MISTELATRILLTVFIVGAYSINYCRASDDSSVKSNQNIGNDEQTVSSVESSLSSRSFKSANEAENNADTRLMPDSAEAGILLPPEDDLPHQGGSGARRLSDGYFSNKNEDPKQHPSSVSFSAKPVPLRVSNSKALNWDSGKLSGEDEKPTYYIRNNCFGPRCSKNNNNHPPAEDWKTVYYNNKESKAKKYDDNMLMGPARRLEDNVMESMSSNFHSQLAIPFVVVDDSINSLRRPQTFSRRSGLDGLTRMTSTTNSPGWIKLKPISPDAYDPFHYSKNTSRNSEKRQNTFSKRDSSNANSNTVSFSKRVGVELNPESFADRWGWSGDGNDNNNNRGGSRLPAWLEEQLKYGTRNSDNKNWVKLDPIPVAGVSISKWVPKGTPSQDLPTTNWQTNRDRPNGGSPWWDRIDQNRILSGNGNGNNGNRHAFLRPGAEDSYNPPQSNNMGWGQSNSNKGSSLTSLDRYPTNSWNDVIYPEGPVSATVSWQQTKGTDNRQNYPSSFPSGGGGGSSGWSSGTETRKPIVATGSWSAPQNNRIPSYLNRFSDHRPSSYPTKQINEDDPRWVLISNTRRVAVPNDRERTKVLSYLNRLHPDLDRSSDFPFYEPSSTAHRHEVQVDRQ
ncbi:unnamed protein product [Orchesella dallaii]|uniref:Uncharacterized protein n=1 Tax=Orchesella dallaii TaxID=48710 RepID=A0ABP1QTM4_9HEXA